ncbi:MAG: hypothetical protein HOC71_06550 [Candidatus Latescibacteria bacterium]|nr:hypothetical protein [Candidatus Latescibacterota bacterium]
MKKKRKNPQKKIQNTESVSPFSRKVRKAQKTIKNHMFLSSFLTVFVLFVIVLLAFTPKYQTNDDVSMQWAVSGTGVVEQPDEHVRFSNVLIGLILKELYTFSPYFPWYASYHFIVHFLSMTMLLYAILYKRFTWTRFSFFFIYFAGLELYFLNNLQFTITSFIAGQSGIFLFLAFMNEKGLKSWIMTGISSCLLLISLLVRYNSFYLVLLVAFPAILVFLVIHFKNSFIIYKSVGFFLVTFFLVVFLNNFNKAYYENDPDWKDYYRLNSIKSRFIDYPHVTYSNSTRHIFDEVNWSVNDFYMLKTWFYSDESIFSIENLEKVASNFPKYNPRLTFNIIVTNLLDIFQKTFIPIFMGIVFSLCIIKSRRDYLITIIGTAVFIVFLMSYLLITAKLPERVYFPMISFFVVLSAFLSERDLNFSTKEVGIRELLFTLAFMSLFFLVYQLLLDSAQNRQESKSIRRSMESMKSDKNKLFVNWGASFPHTKILPFENLEFLSDFNVLQLGTSTRSPFNKMRKADFNIKDLYRAMYEKDNIYFIVSNLRYLYYFANHVQEHLNMDVQYTYYFEDRNLKVIRVVDETDPEYREETSTKKIGSPYR